MSSDPWSRNLGRILDHVLENTGPDDGRTAEASESVLTVIRETSGAGETSHHYRPGRKNSFARHRGPGRRREADSNDSTRPPSGAELGICYRLYRHGIEVAQGLTKDPSFFFAWWGAPDGANHRDPRVWKAANPGYGDLIDPDDFAASVVTTPEAEFRTKRLNQWVSAATAWLPAGSWGECVDRDREIPDGSEVVLGFDGSYNNDSTGVVVCTVGDDPFLDVVWASERPKDAPQDWVVPIDEAEDAIRAACRRWQVREVACDPSRWARSMQVLESERLPMVEFPQTGTRMIPATERFYEAVMNKALGHSGDPALARHIGNAVIRRTSHGGHLQKDAKGSPRKIDLAVAAVMALDRASFNVRKPTPRVVNLAQVLIDAGESPY